MIENNYFIYRKVDFKKLIPFGFKRIENGYVFSTQIVEKTFDMQVYISLEGTIETKLIDVFTNEEFVLHLVKKSKGSFVSKVKEEYESVLEIIKEKCTIKEVFTSKQTKEVIQYVRDKYQDELEHLWAKSPQNAIWRRKDNQKWYAAILTISKNKLGISSDETVEIIDLRIDPKEMDKLIDNTHYFPGYHMNKKSWYTMILNHSITTQEICQRIDESYLLAKK